MPRRARHKTWKFKGNDYKSKLEYDVATNLHNRSIFFDYETRSYDYIIPVMHSICPECGTGPANLPRTYTPDFFLGNGIVVECKGRFTAEERKKHIAMKEQHPDLDLRMLFQTNNWLTARKKKRYGDWCDSKGIKWAAGRSVPQEWIK